MEEAARRAITIEEDAIEFFWPSDFKAKKRNKTKFVVA
jgi:hypothetical protein